MGMIAWIEPFGPNNEPVLMVVQEATAIAFQKDVYENQSKPYPSDQGALEDFIVVHWAKVLDENSSFNDYFRASTFPRTEQARRPHARAAPPTR